LKEAIPGSPEIRDRFSHVTDPALRKVLGSISPTPEAIRMATNESLRAAVSDLQNGEVPGHVAVKRAAYADAAQDALDRGNQWRCRAALRKFWLT